MGVKEGEIPRQGNAQRPTRFGLLGPARSGPQHHSDEKANKYKPTFLHVDPFFVPDVPVVRQILQTLTPTQILSQRERAPKAFICPAIPVRTAREPAYGKDNLSHISDRPRRKGTWSRSPIQAGRRYGVACLR